MGRIFLKLYSILAVAVIVYVVCVANLNTILQGTLERYFSNLAQGTFDLLKQELEGIPEKQWPDFLNEINKDGGYAFKLLPLDSPELPQEQLERIKQGDMVATLIHNASYSYTRIKNTNWVIEFPFEQSEYNHNQRLSSSTFLLIEKTLLAKDETQWPSILEDLNKRFNFPITIQPIDQTDLPTNEHKKLIQGEIIWQDIDVENEFLYRRINNTPYVIKIGPFYEPITLSYLQSILLITLAILVALAVLLWIYPLWRDLMRLRTSAEAFGQGDFRTRFSLPKRSALKRLAETFNSMADRIQSLISSHKELTNAVSHELRTPIARLRFGMEMLKNAKSETERQRFMNSMNADIDELDQLVAELLTYARFDRDKPTLKFQRQEVTPWLSKVVEQTSFGNNDLEVNFQISGSNFKHAQFEPRLLARALGNLLQNAKRYAKNQINVSFSRDQRHYQLCIDDDGPGIPPSERERIFEAFTRLDASRDRDTGGYGLGLAIVDRIAQWHRGSVYVEDSPLGGARFVIRWPETAELS